MKSRTVLITGGATGTGAATAMAFACKGYNIIISYNNTDAQPVTERIREKGVSVHAVKCDITVPEERHRLAAVAADYYCGIDVLVNNAGYSWQGLFTDMTDEEWHKTFDTNVTGPALLTRDILPHMLSAGHGSIVNISSCWGLKGASTEVAYSASKFALTGFTQALAAETELSGITVNAVCPGPVNTAMMKRYTETEITEICSNFPLGRPAEPEEVAELVLLAAESSENGKIYRINC